MAKDTVLKSKISLRVGRELIWLEKPIVMGILNLTPDSFFEGSRLTINTIKRKAEEMLKNGALILDIGGYSTRPNAEFVSISEEISRVVPAIEAIKSQFPNAIISIDTFRADVALAAINAGADIINDVSGGTLDKRMFEMVARLSVPYVLMHMRGNPQTMMQYCNYNNVAMDVFGELSQKVLQLRQLGVADIIIDPGFGFAKTTEQNHQLLKNLAVFQFAKLPLMVGISRKSMVYKPLHESAETVLAATQALHWEALKNGANILRVHDVVEAVQTIKLFLYHQKSCV